MASHTQRRLMFSEPDEPVRVPRVGDRARVIFRASRYLGVVGTVRKIEQVTRYAILDMPKGTELRLENIKNNLVLSRLKPTARNEYKGDPQWFPLTWLVKVEKADDAEPTPDERKHT
jgi:hypothetical protein